MRFWHIKSPDYTSDYKALYINGSLIHPFGLPGVVCDVCRATYGGIRYLPMECPESFRNHKNIMNGWPIPRTAHEKLQIELMEALSLHGEPFVTFRPGDDFQPCFLDVPSRPRADFLWSSIGSLVVSERIKNALNNLCPNDFIACPVTLRKIGKREANLPAPIPDTGEPEDLLNEVPYLKDTSQIGKYFEIFIKKESENPPGVKILSICPVCRRENIDNDTREICMRPEMWKGDSIFFLATTLYIIITDDLKIELSRLRPTNISFEELCAPYYNIYQMPIGRR